MSRRGIFDRMALKLEIILCLAWARLLITVLSFRRLRPALGPIFETQDSGEASALSAPQRKKAADAGRFIRRISRRMPFRADCVPQAMAGRWILARRGIATRIVIGTRRASQSQELEFHAWLMAGELVVTGGHAISGFRPFQRHQVPAAYPAHDPPGALPDP